MNSKPFQTDPRLQNQNAWQKMAEAGHRLTRVASDEEMGSPLKSVDRYGWLGDNIAGWRVLCLAAGGGRHGPIYAAAGAAVTVVDLASAMLERDRWMANKHGLSMRLLQLSMDEMAELNDSEFDLVIHPVSTCYVADVGKVMAEVARVTRIGGLYISQHKQPASLQTSLQLDRQHYWWQYDRSRAPLPPLGADSLVREPGTLEYAHSLQALLGGMCRAGFAIEDFVEPEHADPAAVPGTFQHRSCFVPPYLRIKARRVDRSEAPGSHKREPLWRGDEESDSHHL